MIESYSSAKKKIRREISEDFSEVRKEFLKRFPQEIEQFIKGMTDAFLNWRTLDAKVSEDSKRANISALVYCAITLQILSMKLFLSGYIVAAGNLQRQVFETIALALLCSCSDLGVLDRFMKHQYSPSKAVHDVRKKAKKLSINKNALDDIKQGHDFYHKYSHPTYMTIASLVSFSKKGLYVGASFDEEKLEQYEKEVKGRANLASVFSNFIDGVKANIKKW